MSFNPGDEVGILRVNNMSLGGVGTIVRRINGFRGADSYDVAEYPAGRINRYRNVLLVRLNNEKKAMYGNKINIVKRNQENYNEYLRRLEEEGEIYNNNNGSEASENNNEASENNVPERRNGGKRRGGKTHKGRRRHMKSRKSHCKSRKSRH